MDNKFIDSETLSTFRKVTVPGTGDPNSPQEVTVVYRPEEAPYARILVMHTSTTSVRVRIRVRRAPGQDNNTVYPVQGDALEFVGREIQLLNYEADPVTFIYQVLT